MSRAAFNRFVLPTTGISVAVAAWWFSTWFFQIRTFFLPSPPEVVTAFRRNSTYLGEQTWVTIIETLAGFIIGAAAGLLVATGLGASQALERATLPLVIALNAVPKVALAPLLLLWLGLGHAPKIALAASICFFPVMIAALAGLNSTPYELVELARSLSASRWKTFIGIRLPWALPQIFVGLKLGITLAVIGTVVAQIVRPSGGLGTVILQSRQTVNTPLSFAAIFLLMVMSIVLYYAVAAGERLAVPWARETTTRA